MKIKWAILLCALTVSCGKKEEKSKVKNEPSTKCDGVHQCMSSSSIGHQCFVSGIFGDSNEGYFSLKNEDCCPETANGGYSVGFTTTSCMLM